MINANCRTRNMVRKLSEQEGKCDTHTVGSDIW